MKKPTIMRRKKSTMKRTRRMLKRVTRRRTKIKTVMMNTIMRMKPTRNDVKHKLNLL